MVIYISVIISFSIYYLISILTCSTEPTIN
nr:MAG TPA: hypothetical protein [Caudoviricetes sp.]